MASLSSTDNSRPDIAHSGPYAASSKNFRCHRCDRQFARLEHLQRHDRSHTKEKPFRCSLCSKAFTRNQQVIRDLLSRHSRLTHQSNQRPEAGAVAATAVTSFSVPNSSYTASLGHTAGHLAVTAGELNVTTSPGWASRAQRNLDAVTMITQQESGAFDGSNDTLSYPVQPVRSPYSGATQHFSDTDAYSPDDFASFLDSIPPSTFSFLPTYQPFPLIDLDIESSTVANSVHCNETQWTSPERTDPGLSRFGSRLPSLQPEESSQDSRPQPRHDIVPTVTDACRERMLHTLESFAHVVPDRFVLPSRHTLSRFISGYFRGFHNHYPILHIPTLQLESISVDLLLSISALGAQYCKESRSCLKLFYVAKAIAWERIHRDKPAVNINNLGSRTERDRSDSFCSLDRHQVSGLITTDLRSLTSDEEVNSIQRVQCLLLLIAISMWFKDREIHSHAFSLRSVLDFLIREQGLKTPQSYAKTTTWKEWVGYETATRTKLIIFCFFNIHTIFFNTPPMILSSEIDLELPCTEKEWRADDEGAWLRSRSTQPRFQDAFRDLFLSLDSQPHPHSRFSSMGGYVLIHAILQNIWLLQQTSRLLPRLQQVGSSLPLEEVDSFEKALKRWCSGWERSQESSMDPLSPYGPVSFNSTALLRLAYIRINMDVDSIQSLRSWDASEIAHSLHLSPPVQRSARLTRAVLHCAHALSIPIKLGINFVAQTQILFWSNQHALCSLESASLLSKWLQIITVPGLELTREEKRLLEFVLQMIAETEYNAPPEQLLENSRRMSAIIVRLWATLFRSDSVWEMVTLVGNVLEAYADLLELTTE